MATSRERLGIDRLDIQLAVVFGVLSAVGWAVITGANSSPAGRLGLALVGAPIGVLAGLRTGWTYRDSGPTGRAFLHWIGYVGAVLLVSVCVNPGRPSIDTLVAASVFVPIALVVGRNLVPGGDRRLAAGLSPLVLAGAGLLVVVDRDGSGAQIVAGAALVLVLGFAACVDGAARRARIASGDLPPPPPRRRPVGWRLWARVVGIVLCASAAAASLGPVEVDDTKCGSLPEALQAPPESDCAGEARFQAFGGWVLALAATVLCVGVIRGRPEKAVAGTAAPPADDAGPPEESSSRTGMLVLGALLLVIAAQVVRVVGVVSDGTGLLIASIALTAVAALVLVAAVYRGRRRRRP